ncbi:hypothetical protein TNCV_4603691 [Trichonephila clavipes]|nr:hypothetical protein TNCV_4603691 [Trichonephila clavipes]
MVSSEVTKIHTMKSTVINSEQFQMDLDGEIQGVEFRGAWRSMYKKITYRTLTVWHEDKMIRFETSLRAYKGSKLVQTSVTPGSKNGPYTDRYGDELGSDD